MQAHYHHLGAGPMPEPGWEKHLKKLAAEIKKLQAELQQLTEQLPANKQLEIYLAKRAAERDDAAKIMSALAGLPSFSGGRSIDSLM